MRSRQRDDTLASSGAAAGRRPDRHPLLALQRTAGNQAVASLLEDGPAVQRRLMVAGAPADVRAMLGLLEPASGFTLKHEKDRSVSATASVGNPPSVVLAARLLTIMEDRDRDAEVNLGRTQQAVSFGAFPGDMTAKHLVQELRIDHFLALEKGVPGAGVAKLAHEIVENYAAHSLRDDAFAFQTAHKEALDAERLVGGELDKSRGVAPAGARRNSFTVVTGRGAGASFLEIEDREHDFMVWSRSFDGKNVVSGARRAPRERVASYMVKGFAKGSDALPAGATATIKELATLLEGQPTTSALVTGLSGVEASAGDDRSRAIGWADSVMQAVVDTAGHELTTNWRRFHLEGEHVAGKNCVAVTVDRPFL